MSDPPYTHTLLIELLRNDKTNHYIATVTDWDSDYVPPQAEGDTPAQALRWLADILELQAAAAGTRPGADDDQEVRVERALNHVLGPWWIEPLLVGGLWISLTLALIIVLGLFVKLWNP